VEGKEEEDILYSDAHMGGGEDGKIRGLTRWLEGLARNK